MVVHRREWEVGKRWGAAEEGDHQGWREQDKRKVLQDQ